MQKGIFVTGTDTHVGKTVVTAGLAGALHEMGYNVGVMKPVATGASWQDGKLISSDAMFLRNLAGVEDDLALINPYLYETSVAASVAARIEKREEVNLKLLEDRFFELTLLHEINIVEGAGGLLSPLNSENTVLDLILTLGCSLVVVAKPSLGTINHTLLTVNYARQMGIDVLGIIINAYGKDKIGVVERTNPEEIRRFSPVPLLGILPYLDGVNVEANEGMGLVEAVKHRIDMRPLLGDNTPDWMKDIY